MPELMLKGKYDEAKVFTHNIDDVTIGQVIEFLNQPFATNANTRIMPDCHAGKGAVIGTTMKVTDRIVPNLVGVDIGCGMGLIEIEPTSINFDDLDSFIRKTIPSGNAIRGTAHAFAKTIPFDQIKAPFDINRAALSVASLGGGNHFLEINGSYDGRMFIVVHSGSRHLGVKVATYHQNRAIEILANNRDAIDEIIQTLKQQGRHAEIEAAIKSYKQTQPAIPKDLAYLEGDAMQDYLDDLRIAQWLANRNREAMLDEVVKGMGFKVIHKIDTIHNYVDLEHMILRKGAISARNGEEVLIPINMRDGSLLATGKGNEDWNYSAPHGAGRILSRSKAKATLSVDDFKSQMQDVYSTTVNASTLDESPMAYKSMDEIIENTKDTIEIQAILRPLYNFKASE